MLDHVINNQTHFQASSSCTLCFYSKYSEHKRKVKTGEAWERGWSYSIRASCSNQSTLSNSKWSMSLKNPSQNSSTDQKTGYSIYSVIEEHSLVNIGGHSQYNYTGSLISAYTVVAVQLVQPLYCNKDLYVQLFCSP